MALNPNSYTSQSRRLIDLLRETRNLYRIHSEDPARRVGTILSNLRSVELTVKKEFGLELRNLSVLDVGCGQLLIQLIFFGQFNRAVGIDWDIVPQNGNPLSYLSMLATNGPRRVVKTIGRKLLGIDRRYHAETMARLNLKTLPEFTVYQMDACKMSLPDDSFDFVHSYSVFHHLPEPEAAAAEVVRVLKPGGVAYLSFHLFTSETGSLDNRARRDEQGRTVRWPHLRPRFAGEVVSPAHLNRLRLNDWRELFQAKMPGAKLILTHTARAGAEQDARHIIQTELPDYNVEELLVHDVTVLWRKPAHSRRG